MLLLSRSSFLETFKMNFLFDSFMYYIMNSYYSQTPSLLSSHLFMTSPNITSVFRRLSVV